LYTLLENVPSAVSHLPSRTPEVNSVITCCLEKLRSRVQTRCYEGTIMGFLLHVVIFLFLYHRKLKRIPEVVVMCFNNAGPVWRA
jgi:hypothetical protein